jgi:hypothetical protein
VTLDQNILATSEGTEIVQIKEFRIFFVNKEILQFSNLDLVFSKHFECGFSTR